MLLILLLSCLAVAARLPLVVRLPRQSRRVGDRGDFDRAVLRDRLPELNCDVAGGMLTDSEATSVRLEIQRRLIAADSVPRTTPQRRGRSPVLGWAAAGGAVALYLLMGAPAIPGSPFAAPAAVASEAPDAGSGPAGHNDLPLALDKLTQKLKADPSNTDGWVLYARTAGSLRRWDQALEGYRHAMALGAVSPDIQAGYGETLVLQADGVVTPAAHDAFVAALKDDPRQDVAQYYLALAAGQGGQPEKAIALFQGLLASIPEDSPMRAEIGKRIGEAANAAGLPVPPLAKGTPAEADDPDAAAIDAVAGLPNNEQKTMIADMVAKLAARLAAEPRDVDGWMRLGHAYVVMNERDKAADAYDHAVALTPGDADIRLQAAEGLLSGLKPDDPLPLQAVAMLRQVETIAPEQPAVLWYLGIVAARNDRPVEAKQYWTRLLARLPGDGADAKMVKGAMASLQGG